MHGDGTSSRAGDAGKALRPHLYRAIEQGETHYGSWRSFLDLISDVEFIDTYRDRFGVGPVFSA
jgi:hypothetical protein